MSNRGGAGQQMNGQKTPGPPIRVLLADADRHYRTLIRHLIHRDQRLEIVGEAEDGVEAIKLSLQVKPDVIVLDLCMPHMDGLQAVEGIQSVSPASRILACSNLDENFGKQAVDLGADDHTSKAAGWTEIRSRVIRLASEASGRKRPTGNDWVSPYLLAHLMGSP
ncbi:MAG: response regulator [Actinomycetota bacterium]|nr:response regulator [Actinomycetota bacterium]